MAVAGLPLAPPPFFGNMDSSPPPPLPRSRLDYSTSMLVIGALVAVVIAVSAAIHLALRLLSRRRSPPPPPTSIIHDARLPGRSSASSSSMAPPDPSDPHQKALIDSLPLLTVDDTAAIPNPSSPADCAVCLSPFRPGDALRLLPACRHTFHAPCIDAWILRSTPSCPLCRRPIVTPSRSGSFCVEIGAVNRRRSSSESSSDVARQGRMRRSSSYSLGSSSFDYLAADAEVRSVLPEKDAAGTADSAPPPPPPGEAAGSGSSRSWLREYVERLTSSSSFSSFRLSSRRFDTAAAAPVSSAAVDVAGGFAGNSWDLEENEQRPALVGEGEEVAGGNFYISLGRWLMGVSS